MAQIKLFHYFNEATNDEYLVLVAEDDEEDYGEEGYKLSNECELLSADTTLPLGAIFTRD